VCSLEAANCECAEGEASHIVEWVRFRDNRFVSEPLEIDGETIRDAREYAVWDVVLSCGHFAQERTKPGWKPEDVRLTGRFPSVCASIECWMRSPVANPTRRPIAADVRRKPP
jgi:hypothetical protein